jgi:hypothetical protein
MNCSRVLLCLGPLALLFSTGCSATLAQPFENLKNEPITVYRLQNFEPPAAPTAAATPAIPFQIPPQIQQWLGGAAQMLPPGLIPPGLLPGGAPLPAANANVPRFHNFRILGTMQVMDKKQHGEILDVFGHDGNFDVPRQTCQTLYAEFGFQFGQGSPAGGMVGAPPTGMPADVLVSLSCNQVQMINYGWPYGTKTGLTPDTTKRIVAIVQQAFGGS